jgi:hypothetical protein
MNESDMKLMMKFEKLLEDIKSCEKQIKDTVTFTPEEKIYVDSFLRNSNKFQVNVGAVIDTLKMRGKK